MPPQEVITSGFCCKRSDAISHMEIASPLEERLRLAMTVFHMDSKTFTSTSAVHVKFAVEPQIFIVLSIPQMPHTAYAADALAYGWVAIITD